MDASELNLIASALSDAGTRARLEKLADAKEEAERAQVAAEATLNSAHETLAEARKLREEGQSSVAETDKLKQELDRREKGLGEAITTYNADRESFNRIRAQIEADLKERGEKLAAAEASNKRLTQELMDREMKLALEEQNVKDLKVSLALKHTRLHQALAMNEAEEEPAAAA